MLKINSKGPPAHRYMIVYRWVRPKADGPCCSVAHGATVTLAVMDCACAGCSRAEQLQSKQTQYVSTEHMASLSSQWKGLHDPEEARLCMHTCADVMDGRAQALCPSHMATPQLERSSPGVHSGRHISWRTSVCLLLLVPFCFHRMHPSKDGAAYADHVGVVLRPVHTYNTHANLVESSSLVCLLQMPVYPDVFAVCWCLQVWQRHLYQCVRS